MFTEIDPLQKYLKSCIYYLLVAPAINDAWLYRMHWDRAQLQHCFPKGTGIPRIVLTAIESLERGYATGLRDKHKEMEKRNK